MNRADNRFLASDRSQVCVADGSTGPVVRVGCKKSVEGIVEVLGRGVRKPAVAGKIRRCRRTRPG
jgi:hypothetical protein